MDFYLKTSASTFPCFQINWNTARLETGTESRNMKFVFPRISCIYYAGSGQLIA